MNMAVEKPAKGVKGFLLYNPFTDHYWFRVYNPENKREYKDYKLSIEDLEIEILAGGASLYESEEGNRISWASEYLHHDGQRV